MHLNEQLSYKISEKFKNRAYLIKTTYCGERDDVIIHDLKLQTYTKSYTPMYMGTTPYNFEICPTQLKQNGWSPILSVVPDGDRRVLKVVDWTGGTKPKPKKNVYLTSSGYTTDISEATNIAGGSSSPEPIETVVAKFGIKTTSDLPTEEEIENGTSVEYISGGYIPCDFSDSPFAERWYWIAYPTSEPDYSLYDNGQNQGALGDEELFSALTVIGSWKCTQSNYSTILPYIINLIP